VMPVTWLLTLGGANPEMPGMSEAGTPAYEATDAIEVGFGATRACG
jgi:hypothetical protein